MGAKFSRAQAYSSTVSKWATDRAEQKCKEISSGKPGQCIVEQGGELGPDDINPKRIRQIIFGGIEYICLPYIVYNLKIRTESFADELFEVLFGGISKK